MAKYVFTFWPEADEDEHFDCLFAGTLDEAEKLLDFLLAVPGSFAAFHEVKNDTQAA